LSDITIREYLEQRLDYERTLVKHQLDAIREMLEQRLDAMDSALVLQRNIDHEKLQMQAVEYERRLTVLNHAHEDAVREKNRVLPREMFEQWASDFSKWRDIVNKSMGDVIAISERITGIDARAIASMKEYESFKLDVTRAITTATATAQARITTLGIMFSVITILIAATALFWRH
jgi:hypothetical protein